MTIEQKAKAYDEALERAKIWKDKSGMPKDKQGILDDIFPELKESEDERIRKALLRFHKSTIDIDGIKGGDILAWLENIPYTIDREKREGFHLGYKAGIEKQGEPIDINPSEFDLRLNKLLKQFETLPKEELASSLSFYLNVVQNDGTYKADEKQGEQKINDDDKTILENWKCIVKDNKEKWQLSDWFVEATLLLVQKIEQIGLSKPIVDNNKTILNACINVLRSVGHSHLAAWLEKQGEKNPCETCEEPRLNCQNFPCEKKKNFDFSNKVEPKFKNGQWIVWRDKCYKVNYNGCGYELVDQDGLSTSLEYGTIDENAHIWDVTTDAKDGDVLASELCDSIILFKGINDDNNIDFYCDYYFSEIDVPGDRFSVNNGQHYGNVEDSKDFHPTTKEQRDILMKAMADAGYAFDFKKLELKKIVVPIFNIGDTIVEKDLDECSYGTIKDIKNGQYIFTDGSSINIDEQEEWQLKTSTNIEQKTADWSEEDEKILHNIEQCIYDNVVNIGAVNKVRYVDWLKSLRQRIGG